MHAVRFKFNDVIFPLMQLFLRLNEETKYFYPPWEDTAQTFASSAVVNVASLQTRIVGDVDVQSATA